MSTMSHVLVTKANGKREVFDPQKLERSLKRAGASDEAVEDVQAKIQQHLVTGVTTKEIYTRAFEYLGDTSRHAAANYSLRRAIMDMGPSGFPFEQLIAAIFGAQGYTTETGLRLLGQCVSHEVDVAAYKTNELHLIEAKFHNQAGVKTDTKVALYVKARYDDLGSVEITLGGAQHKLTQGWLITNTKFTSGAITYGLCNNMKMIGWNYPKHGNLQDLIIEARLHPLTSLTSTSQSEENMLLEQDIVLLRQLVERPEALDRLGLSAEKKRAVLDEARAIIAA